jgi:hypothetical protein
MTRPVIVGVRFALCKAKTTEGPIPDNRTAYRFAVATIAF